MGRTTKNRRNPSRAAKRPSPAAKSTKTICSVKGKTLKKTYDAHDDKAKLRINQLFAAKTVKFLGKKSKIIILDTAQAVTAKTLISTGISKSRIMAPNINMPDCRALREFGVRDYYGNIEDCVMIDRFDAGWYDSMTTMGGNVKLRSYVGLFAHRFLESNRGKPCVLAITVGPRSNQVLCNYLPQKKIFTHQITALIAFHGFVVKEEPVIDCYKKNNIFGMWTLVPAKTKPSRLKFLTHKGRSRLIGFPVGFTENDL